MTTLTDIIQGKGLSLIPQLHLQQIDLFLWRKGIEIYPIADIDNTRQKFLHHCWRANKTALYLTDIWEKGAVSGSVLLYIRPNGSSYKLSYYPASEFKPYYNADGDLETVVIQTSYQTESEAGEVTRYSKLRIKPQTIEKWDSDRPIVPTEVPDSVTPNPYNRIPCIVIDNKPSGQGKRGKNEFAGLEAMIENHDWKLQQVDGNLEFFGGPIFYSSRSRQEMTEAGMVEERHSIAAAGGYGHSQRQERIKARRIFDNLEAGEQIGFATPEPITPETLNFIRDYGRQIRAALGGSDEAERTTTQGTSFELKSLLATAIQTATKRAESYLTYGIAAAYQLILEMAESDGVLPVVSPDKTVHWRHLGDVFQDTAQDLLTKSIVGRNLLRMGVNVEECLRFLFPDKRDNEIEALLQNGFAYEFLNGIASVARTLLSAKDTESGEYAIAIDRYINEVLNARPTGQSTTTTSAVTTDERRQRRVMVSPND